MSRTNSTKVEEILGFNYATASSPSLQPYIDTANTLVNQLVTDAALKSLTIPNATLELIERWLSAYFYTKMDPLYKSKGTDKARGDFQRTEKDYLDVAIMLDPTGLIEPIIESWPTVEGGWLGKTDTEALDYNTRMG